MNPGYDRPDYPGSTRAISYECMSCHNALPEDSRRQSRRGRRSPLSRPSSRGHRLPALPRPRRPAHRHLRQGAHPQSRKPHAGARTRSLPAMPPRNLQPPAAALHTQTRPRALLLRGRTAARGFPTHLRSARRKEPGRRSRRRRLPLPPVAVLPEKQRQAALHHLPQPARHPARRDRGCRIQQGLRRLPRLISSRHENCVACHMPKTRTDDAVHIVITDHRIQRPAAARHRSHGRQGRNPRDARHLLSRPGRTLPSATTRRPVRSRRASSRWRQPAGGTAAPRQRHRPPTSRTGRLLRGPRRGLPRHRRSSPGHSILRAGAGTLPRIARDSAETRQRAHRNPPMGEGRSRTPAAPP